MANETGGAAFARDLGYLDKFFANLTAYADTLSPAQGQRLKQLMAEEALRWKEIRQLIAGQNAPQAAIAPAEPKPQVPSPAASAPPNEPQPQFVAFTVGSLLGQPKK